MADERQPEWTIEISQFNGYVPSWFKNDWPSFGAKEDASDMQNIDLIDPNVMKPGPVAENLQNGDENGVVTTLVKAFQRQVVSNDLSYAIGGDRLYQLTSTDVVNTGAFPYQITGTDIDGQDVVSYQDVVLYLYNGTFKGGPGGDVGLMTSGFSFNDDYGSTVMVGGAVLAYAPHQAIVAGDDAVYFTNGQYVGKITYSTGTYSENATALDFNINAQTASLTWNENRVKIAINRPNVLGVNLNQSGIYSWNGYSSSWEGDPIEVNGRIGALFTKNGVDYVWWQDAGSNSEFRFGYISGTQLQVLKTCTGTLPGYYQVGEYLGFIKWMSDGFVYLYGKLDADSPTKYFQFTQAMYQTNFPSGLVEELIKNGGFDASINEWTTVTDNNEWAWAGGKAVVTANAGSGSDPQLNQTLFTQLGLEYTVSFKYEMTAAAGSFMVLMDGAELAEYVYGVYPTAATVQFTYTETSWTGPHVLSFRGSAANYSGTLDTVSFLGISGEIPNAGGIGVPFGNIFTASSNGTAFSVAKQTAYDHNTSFWKTRAFPMMRPGYVAMVDKIQVNTTQINTAEGTVGTALRYDQNSANQSLTQIGLLPNPRFHKILNKSAKLEDFMLDLQFANFISGTPEPVEIRSILIKGHYVPEN